MESDLKLPALIHPRLDALFLGLSTPLLLVFLSLWGEFASSEILFPLLLIFSFPHFILSFYQFYSEPETCRAHKLVAWVSPLALLLLSLFAYFSRSDLPLVLLVHSTYILLFWHLAKQAYGSSLFLGRSLPLRTFEKNLVLSFCLSLAGASYLSAQTGSGMQHLFRFPVPNLAMNPAVVTFAWQVFTALGLVLLLWACFRSLRNPLPVLHLLIPIAALWLWFDSRLTPLELAAFVPVLHGLQYLPYILRSQWVRLQGPTRRGFALGGIWLIYGISILLGYLWFSGIPLFLAGSSDIQNGQRLFPLLLVAVHLHHFCIDAVAWRLRDPFVKKRLGLALPGPNPKATKAETESLRAHG